MDNLAKVEKLREKANISYDEAKSVLEECDWDLLDAVIKLESMGKINAQNSADYSTKGKTDGDAPQNPLEIAETYQNYQQNQQKKERGIFQTMWSGVKYLFKKGCANKLTVRKDGDSLMEIPVIIVALLLIPFFWLLLVLMIVSLFFGFSYGFAGPDLGKQNINEAMGKATKAAEVFKTDLQENAKEDMAQNKNGSADNDKESEGN